MPGVPEPVRAESPVGDVLPKWLRYAVIAAIGGLVFVAAMNVTAVAASIHPLLGVVALPIVVAAALSITESVCERLADP